MQALLFLLTAALSPAMENMFLNQCVMATNDKEACSCAITQLNGKYNEKTFYHCIACFHRKSFCFHTAGRQTPGEQKRK